LVAKHEIHNLSLGGIGIFEEARFPDVVDELLPLDGAGNVNDHLGDEVEGGVPELIKAVEHLVEGIFNEVCAELVEHEVLDELLLAVRVAAVTALVRALHDQNDLLVERLHLPPVRRDPPHYLRLQLKDPVRHIPQRHRVLFHVWLILRFFYRKLLIVPQIAQNLLLKIPVQNVNGSAKVWQ
jgi:hypothetical protein